MSRSTQTPPHYTGLLYHSEERIEKFLTEKEAASVVGRSRDTTFFIVYAGRLYRRNTTTRLDDEGNKVEQTEKLWYSEYPGNLRVSRPVVLDMISRMGEDLDRRKALGETRPSRIKVVRLGRCLFVG